MTTNQCHDLESADTTSVGSSSRTPLQTGHVPESSGKFTLSYLSSYHLQRFLDLDIIPLQVSSVIDTDLTNLSASELITWGLANLWKEGKEGSYAVWHSQHPINNFGQ